MAYRSRSDIGHERARQHIEDYRRLEAELGGSLDDVRQYFFALSYRQLQQILLAYGQKYGASARDYAEKTIEKWKSRRVHMAGQTAERLFRLLPSYMPLENKYRLIESLWNHVGATTRKTLRIGLDASIEQVIEAVRKHLDDVVVRHRIPTALEGRFKWLAAGDAQLKQDLLNHLRQHMEKNLVVESARLQLPIMQDHLRSDMGRQTFRLAQILKLGNHELELVIDKNASGVAVAEPYTTPPVISRATSTGQGASFQWLWWAIAAAVALFLISGLKTSRPSYQPSYKPIYQPAENPIYRPEYNRPVYQSPDPPVVPSQTERRASAPPPQPSLPVSTHTDVTSDHGPGRVACDLQWSQFPQARSSSYQDFLRNCLIRKIPD